MHKKIVRMSGLAAGAVILLAACGGGSSSSASSSTNPTSTTTGNASGQQSAFRACLSKHGVTLPAGFGNRNGGGGGGNGGGNGGPPGGGTPGTGSRPAGGFRSGANGQKFQQAFQACASLAPAGGFRGGRGGGGFNTEALKAYTSCLSDHGVKVPKITTPTTTAGSTGSTGGGGPGGGPRGRGVLGQLRSDPHFAAANKICRPLLPTFGSTTTTTAP
jgi:hypothetical protein